MPFDDAGRDEVANIDFETASVVNLRQTGQSRYARDPNTHPTCMAWALSSMAEPELWLPGDPIPPRLAAHIARGGTVCAWNAPFEIAIWWHIMVPRFGWPDIPLEQWSC